MSDRKSLESLFQLVHALKRQLHDQASQLDLTITPMHIRVMKIIDRKKPCTAIDIASFLGRDKAQVTRLVNTLINENLITKEPNPEDKRSQYLCVTESGAKLVEEIAKIDANTMKMMTKNLTQQELDEFQRISTLMTLNLESQNS